MKCEKTVDVKKSKFCEADVSSDLQKEVENHYKRSLPEDFYHFWKFCEELDSEKPAADLKRICKTIVEAASDDERLKAFAPIQEMMTFVQFANDECDYGMGLELGMDLFCYGSHYFHKVAGQLLPLAYNLLKRNLFAEIMKDHRANRRKENIDQFAA
ncbi:putative histone PARylation factor 1-like [Pongo abelii]|uniref:putative histone PARylation factor 1-like n=1 Tax=Pongo abelii TaxID=9601 RepID=UPI0030056E18